MRSLYNILFTVFFILSAPYYFWKMWRRGNWRPGFKQRFGQYDNKIKQSLTNRQVLWMHAVSVGEMNVCMQLIRALEPRVPNLKIVVSTTTTTAMGELQKRLPPNIGKIYYPIDRRPYVNRAIATVHPNAIVLIESEIWPNFVWRARALGKPLFLVNARLSPRSYPRYKKFGFIFRNLFASFTAVAAQSEDESVRLREVGCKPQAVHTVGNLKFDAAVSGGRNSVDVGAILAQVGVQPGVPILVAGSTHDGEEKILADIFLRLRERFPDLFMVLVPRHFERAREVADDLSQRGIKFMYRGELKRDDKPRPANSLQCLLVNTTGELRYFYEHATVVFVGKSLTATGGQNPIEPAALGKPVVFGPNMQNFADVTRIFLEKNGVIQVNDATELEKVIGELLGNPARREELGRLAYNIVQENLGATDRTVELILERLGGEDVYIAPKK